MKNTFKKIGAIVLAVVMIMAMSTTAFATDEDMTNESGVIGEFTDTPVTKNTSVIIYKEITAYNPETCVVNAPAVTFNYTIAAGDSGKNVYDASSHHTSGANAHAVTKAGIGSPTITGTAANVITLVPGTAAHQLNASSNGTANRFALTIDFTGIDYTPSTIPSGHTEAEYGPGIYRYVISETTTEATKNLSNIKEGSGANTLYMDVYVNGDGNIYGYVLFTNNVDIDARTDEDSTAASTAGKVEGFVGNQPDDGTYAAEADSTADKYYTFNFEVTKDVVDDAYIETTHHQFPFTINLDNENVTASVLPIMTVSSYATQTALTAGAIGHDATGSGGTDTSTTWTPTIADDASVKYVGVPTGTTVTITETNNVTGTTYSSVSTLADSNAAVKNIFYGDTSNTATVNCGATYLQTATENHTASASKAVTFTNTLLQISPTGVTLRVAPYALMLGAGLFLILFTRRRKEKNEA